MGTLCQVTKAAAALGRRGTPVVLGHVECLAPQYSSHLVGNAIFANSTFLKKMFATFFLSINK